MFLTVMDEIARQIAETQAGASPVVSLTVPCRAEYLALCRLAVGALGAKERLQDEDIADIKMAVTEACSCFIRRPGQGVSLAAHENSAHVGGFLRLEFFLQPHSWLIKIDNPDHRCRLTSLAQCDPKGEAGLGLMIIQALVDKVELTDDEAQGTVFRLTKHLAPRS